MTAALVLAATLSTHNMGVVVHPPDWMPRDVEAKYIPYGLDGSHETSRLTAKVAAGICSIADGAGERLERAGASASGFMYGILPATNVSGRIMYAWPQSRRFIQLGVLRSLADALDRWMANGSTAFGSFTSPVLVAALGDMRQKDYWPTSWTDADFEPDIPTIDGDISRELATCWPIYGTGRDAFYYTGSWPTSVQYRTSASYFVNRFGQLGAAYLDEARGAVGARGYAYGTNSFLLAARSDALAAAALCRDDSLGFHPLFQSMESAIRFDPRPVAAMAASVAELRSFWREADASDFCTNVSVFATHIYALRGTISGEVHTWCSGPQTVRVSWNEVTTNAVAVEEDGLSGFVPPTAYVSIPKGKATTGAHIDVGNLIAYNDSIEYALQGPLERGELPTPRGGGKFIGRLYFEPVGDGSLLFYASAANDGRNFGMFTNLVHVSPWIDMDGDSAAIEGQPADFSIYASCGGVKSAFLSVADFPGGDPESGDVCVMDGFETMFAAVGTNDVYITTHALDNWDEIAADVRTGACYRACAQTRANGIGIKNSRRSAARSLLADVDARAALYTGYATIDEAVRERCAALTAMPPERITLDEVEGYEVGDTTLRAHTNFAYVACIAGAQSYIRLSKTTQFQDIDEYGGTTPVDYEAEPLIMGTAILAGGIEDDVTTNIPAVRVEGRRREIFRVDPEWRNFRITGGYQ